MGYIRRSVVLVLFIQLFGHSEPKTIVYSSYTSDPSASESRQRGAAHQYPFASDTQQDASESTGRGFSSAGGGGASFPYAIHPDFLSKPVQVPRPNVGYKSPKYIVYPSYSQNSPNSVPYYNAPVAMDRFAPGEAYGGTIYKLKKQKQNVQSAPFSPIAAASFNSPVSVPSPGALRPAASDNSPVSVPAPPSPSASGPSPPASPGMQGAPIFMPTPVPDTGEDSSSSDSTDPPNTNSTMDSSELILFPPNSHSGYLPPPANSAKDMKRPAQSSSVESASKPAVYKPPNDLFKFPPNSNASSPPPSPERSKNPVTSYLPPPSGDITGRVVNSNPDHTDYKGSAELFKFPPNVNSGYLPPVDEESPDEHTGTSYGAPPSGDPSAPSNLKPVATNDGLNPTTSLEPNILHRFPPNTLSSYLPPDGKTLPTYTGTSYIPPPSGDPQAPTNMKPLQMANLPPTSPTTGGTFKFPPNIHSDYLPPVGKESPQATGTSYLPPPSGNPNSPANLSPPMTPLNMYVPPVDLYNFPPNVHSQYLPPMNNPPRQNNAVTSYLPPASGIPGDDAIGTISVGPGKPQYLPPYADNGPPMQTPPPPAPMAMMPNKMPPMSMAMMQAMAGPPTGPSGMGADYDHQHQDHHHDHDFPYLSGFDHDHYPDIIFDHDHDHHHHDEPMTTPAPPPPPPPAPETPRLKNYSYYYLSRTLWYVPLYFTLYFTFYVAILIIRSIARHKVNLPNQWVGNTRSFGSIRDLSDKETQQKATMMATFAMKQIEDFREKYL
ncbi:uncharacterized protein LOC128712407 [Anopheles marshallii]|uniref:uncharacterized protein LOC128712407 n=1 Tax=Anopheles marshallii TaxID=1521116 RepID=UPI00237B213D|nr:uncharacterized protein LOC128712407 [Anopheles marshallii]